MVSPLRSPRLILLMTLAMVGMQTDASAQINPEGVDVDFDMEYYDVSGATWSEVWRSIVVNRRTMSTGERFEGVTRYEVGLMPAGDGCTPSNARIAVKLRVAVPHLVRASALPIRDRECWAAYERSLDDHEELHMTIAIQDARELLTTVRASSGASCRSLRNLVQRRSQDMRSDQADYDRVSSHGLEQWRAWGLSRPADPEVQALTRRCAERALG